MSPAVLAVLVVVAVVAGLWVGHAGHRRLEAAQEEEHSAKGRAKKAARKGLFALFKRVGGRGKDSD